MLGVDPFALADKLPLPLQIAFYAIVAIVLLFIVFKKWLMPPDGVEHSEHVVLESATIADMGPVREGAKALVSIDATLKSLVPMVTHHTEEIILFRKVAEEIADQMKDKDSFERGMIMGRQGKRGDG